MGYETLPRWLSGEEPTCQRRRRAFSPWVWKTPWRRKWPPSTVFLPGKSHGQRSLAGWSPWGCKRVRHNLATKRQHETAYVINIWCWHLLGAGVMKMLCYLIA